MENTREIKFRAWDESQKYMAYQGMPDLETLQSFIFHFGDKPLMQYTGRKDKNGQQIYEGDVVKCRGYNRREGEWVKTYVVVFDEESSAFSLQDKAGGIFMIFRKIEVIGNVFENPELICAHDFVTKFGVDECQKCGKTFEEYTKKEK